MISRAFDKHLKSMESSPVRRACTRLVEEICGYVLIYGFGSLLLFWLIGAFTLLPIGIGIYFGYDKHIGMILMITGSIVSFITCVWGLIARFVEFYRTELWEQKYRTPKSSQAVAPVAISIEPRPLTPSHDTAPVVETHVSDTCGETPPSK